MDATPTYEDHQSLSQLIIATHILEPASYAVSTNHLAVVCPICDAAASPMMDPQFRVMRDYMFAVTGCF